MRASCLVIPLIFQPLDSGRVGEGGLWVIYFALFPQNVFLHKIYCEIKNLLLSVLKLSHEQTANSLQNGVHDAFSKVMGHLL